MCVFNEKKMVIVCLGNLYLNTKEYLTFGTLVSIYAMKWCEIINGK